jgi:hypothetical protein
MKSDDDSTQEEAAHDDSLLESELDMPQSDELEQPNQDYPEKSTVQESNLCSLKV